jgi:biotin-(acetyl-CoA carboxylase) ligase
MAGVAALRAVTGPKLKWPNDLILGEGKVGGILVEQSGDEVVIGLGLNLWWPDTPEGTAALFGEDPGPDRHAEIGALWGAELMRLIEAEGWPLGDYRSDCETLGRRITWEKSTAPRIFSTFWGS